MAYRITVLPSQVDIEADGGDLLTALRSVGLGPDAPCGGAGRCGKCTVILDGKEVPACHTVIDRDMTVTIPKKTPVQILTDGIRIQKTASNVNGFFLAFDIGTTTVAGYLLDATGRELAASSCVNPQTAYGADVISRIQHALNGQMEALTGCIRSCIAELTLSLCQKSGIDPVDIRIVSVVGNPAMQQLFLGIRPENLAKIPFSPVLTKPEAVAAEAYLPVCTNAQLLIVPDISGFVGADTAACILVTGMAEREEITLLVDIGTNGEMVLGNRHRLAACSTAAGPALEGANIAFGMRGSPGAIDHVWTKNGTLQHSIIGGGEALGICGSGLIDALAAALDMGLLNSRGRILNDSHTISLTDKIHLTQEDIRQVQMAKGAIAAGICLMAQHLGIELQDIEKVYLAGAFGTFMNPDSACRIGLLPPELKGKTEAVGNAAGSGAKCLALDADTLTYAGQLVDKVEYLEQASVPGFRRCFAENMRLPNG